MSRRRSCRNACVSSKRSKKWTSRRRVLRNPVESATLRFSEFLTRSFSFDALLSLLLEKRLAEIKAKVADLKKRHEESMALRDRLRAEAEMLQTKLQRAQAVRLRFCVSSLFSTSSHDAHDVTHSWSMVCLVSVCAGKRMRKSTKTKLVAWFVTCLCRYRSSFSRSLIRRCYRRSVMFC